MLAFPHRQPRKMNGFTMAVLSSDLIARDLKHIWHPCAQMKDYEVFQPLEIASAEGSYIQLQDGRKLIDATASWWCKSLGHNHPQIKAALLQQINQFEHVMLAHTTHDTIVTLSEKLASLTSGLSKVAYASDGSCAVEMAMKMSVHARQIQGENKRNRFVALENSYHGETVGALSVSDLGAYRKPYATLLFDTLFLSPLPYVANTQDAVWDDCEAQWQIIEKQLENQAETITAVIVEPIVQGASGMKIYSQDFLKRLRAWTTQHGIHLIADEIMTGIGRTGKMLACQHADIEPDFLCLSKGLTSGWLPLSAVLTRPSIYDLFYADYAQGKSFLHSHTHSGNALAASVAVQVLTLMEQEKLSDRANELGKVMQTMMLDIAHTTKKLTQVRSIGAIVAADLVCSHPAQRLGFDFYKKAAELGALMRPLGNTIYWVPPLTMTMDTLSELKKITEQTLKFLTRL